VTRRFSLYLDVLRIVAAVVVVISHFGYSRFTDGRWLWVRELNLGSDAVVIFFVLSGLVIAFTAETKDHGIGAFAFSRITRIVSVALPALVIGFALDRTGAYLFPDFYALGWYEPLPFFEQMLRGMSFSNEWHGMATRLGTNGPYWSLSYEVAYYAIFAMAFYLRGMLRGVLLAGAVITVGLNIMLLAPCWLIGVLLWKSIKQGRKIRRDLALGMMIMPFILYAMALAADLPAILLHFTQMNVGVDGFRFSDEFIWNGLLAVGVGFHLKGASCLLQKEPSAQQRQLIKWLAGGSFSLYLMHYPLLQFLGPALPNSGLPLLDDAILFAATMLLCLAFAQVFERTLPLQRSIFQNIIWPLGNRQRSQNPVHD
jgi:peptidoglycan/LPS O-acetylase OafA/YrhL